MRRAFLKAAAMFGLMPSISLELGTRPLHKIPIVVRDDELTGIITVICANFYNTAYGVTRQDACAKLEHMGIECLFLGHSPISIRVSKDLEDAYFRY